MSIFRLSSYLVLFLLSLPLSSCGKGEHSTTADIGSATFGLRFEQASAPAAMKLSPSMAPAVDICTSYGIDSISGTVYNSSNSVIATGGPWACSDHQGTITNIPAGSNLKIEIKGTVSGSVVWQGETTGVTINAGQDTNVGTVTMTYMGSDTTPPTVSLFSPSSNATNVPVTSIVTATFSESMASSTITTDTFTLFDNGTNSYVSGAVTYDSSSKTATFTPSSNLSYSTNYTAEVLQGSSGVQDMAGWLLQGTSKWNFITEATPTSAPSAPTGVSASTGDAQVTISWPAVTGATSYNIYWSTTSGVTKSNGTPITVATSPYIHTALTNGTTYYYVVTAVNSYGESVESSQVSATPSTAPVATGRMPDTGQTTSYTTTYGEDHDYTINSPSYTDNGNGTVTDNVTGLMWQKQDDGTTMTWSGANAYCETSTLAGYSDWRLPSEIELISIIDNGVYNPAINTTFFPGTSSSYYWSSTTVANYTSYAWLVGFAVGGADFSNETSSYYVRCVRGGQTTPSLTDNGNGTVTDSSTLLIWQQGENSTMTWEAALMYCEGLSLATQTDWRLPNIKELSSLVDDTRSIPAINTTLFPSAISSDYWSSSTYAYNTSGAWVVYFEFGGSYGYVGKTNSYYVRCVRGGQ